MSDMRLYVEPVAMRLDVRIKDLPTQAAKMICEGVTQSGNVENTITASQWSLGHFGSWLATKGSLQENPFNVIHTGRGKRWTHEWTHKPYSWVHGRRRLETTRMVVENSRQRKAC